MKKVFVLFISLLFLIFTGCSAGETDTEAKAINGETPDQIVIRYATADLQNNVRRKIELTVGNERLWLEQEAKEKGMYAEQFGPENNKQLNKNYRLTEYKLNETTFYYELDHSPSNSGKPKYYKVIKTPNGWRIQSDNAEREVHDLIFQEKVTSRILKDYDDEPVYQEQLKKDYDQDKKLGDEAKQKHIAYHSPAQVKINGKTPLDVAIEAKHYQHTGNFKALEKIITPAYKRYYEDKQFSILDDWDDTGNPNRGSVFYYRKQKMLHIEEYKVNEEKYVYFIVSDDTIFKGEFFFTVIKTNEGWKIDVNDPTVVAVDSSIFKGLKWAEGVKPKRILYY